MFFAFASDEQRPVLYVSIWAISYQIDKLLNLVSLVFGGYQTPTTCIRALQALKYARVDTFLHYFLMFSPFSRAKSALNQLEAPAFGCAASASALSLGVACRVPHPVAKKLCRFNAQIVGSVRVSLPNTFEILI